MYHLSQDILTTITTMLGSERNNEKEKNVYKPLKHLPSLFLPLDFVWSIIDRQQILPERSMHDRMRYSTFIGIIESIRIEQSIKLSQVTK